MQTTYWIPLDALPCLIKVRLITPGGAVWQRHGDPKAQAETAIGRASTNIGLPAMALCFKFSKFSFTFFSYSFQFFRILVLSNNSQ